MPPAVSWPAFAETNLRAYVRDPSGSERVWFYSLDATSATVAFGARLMLGAPYFRASADVDIGDGVCYLGVRAGRRAVRYRLHIQPGPPKPSSDLDVWLTHRWRAYTRHLGRLLGDPRPAPVLAAAGDCDHDAGSSR